MKGSVIYSVLIKKGIHFLFHANTVTTSCNFLKLGGIASRGYISDLRMPQTPQSSDVADQKLGLWYDVFIDSVDIHDRARKRNDYGPVIFVLSVDIMNNLPLDSEVLVTKKNPIYWIDGEPTSNRLFLTPEELSSSFEKGTFGQMLIVRTPGGFLPFTDKVVPVVLDDPQRPLSKGNLAYDFANAKLRAVAGKTSIVSKRQCMYGCKCLEQYKDYYAPYFDSIFM
jgi:hypothetical protein